MDQMDDRPTPETIFNAACMVANELQNKYIDKKHGGYAVYRDDRIRVTLDTYAPNVAVRIIHSADRDETVFSCAYHSAGSPNVYRPGAWVSYLLDRLLPMAMEVAKERRTEEHTRQVKREAMLFGPVDDAAIFAEKGGA